MSRVYGLWLRLCRREASRDHGAPHIDFLPLLGEVSESEGRQSLAVDREQPLGVCRAALGGGGHGPSAGIGPRLPLKGLNGWQVCRVCSAAAAAGQVAELGLEPPLNLEATPARPGRWRGKKAS